MDNIRAFTEKCRRLQSCFREEIQEPMGFGLWKTSAKEQISMIANGENTGRNFVNGFTFEYAKQRIAGKKKNETIDEYRLFNNLLSSQPMAFNLFCPLIQMLKERKDELTTRIVQSIFPDFNIGQVTEIELEYLHTDVENYLNDRTAMDAIIRYVDTEARLCFVAIETKYTDILGTNSATHTDKQKALIKELGFFKPESEKALLCNKRTSARYIGTFCSRNATALKSQLMSAIQSSSVLKTIRRQRKRSDPYRTN